MKTRNLFYRAVTAAMLLAVLLLQGIVTLAGSAHADGPITFTKHIVDPDFYRPQYFYATDLDRDGDIDILCPADYGNTIAWWENDGAQNFTKHVIDSSFRRAHRVYATDVDGDGDVDVLGAATTSEEIAWWENDGAQNFTKHVVASAIDAMCVYATDIDDDGDVDILGVDKDGGAIVWWENDGNENFAGHTITDTLTLPWWVYATDMDGDGDVDVLGTDCWGSAVIWWENDGNENFTGHTIDDAFAGPYTVYAVDMDGDGDVDVLAAATGDDEIAWWENDGAQNFAKHTVTNTFDGASSAHAADLDGDGDMDVLGTAVYGGTIAWWENDGTENFTRHTVDSAFPGTLYAIAIDIDGDGALDILGSSYDLNDIAWYENSGGPEPTPTPTPEPGPCDWHTELVDQVGDVGGGSNIALDADDHPHIAYTDYTNGDLKYAHHDGTDWDIQIVHSPGTTGYGPSLALDSNGNPHIAWNYYTPSYSLMYGYYDGSTWHIENVHPGSWPGPITLALDSNDRPHISYFTDVDGGPNANSLLYTRHDGTSWHTEKVDSSSAAAGIGSYLVLDSLDQPHIAYALNYNHAVKYAWYDGVSWQYRTVDSDGQMVGDITVALDSSEYAHIAYIDRSRGIMRYYKDSGSSWYSQTVSSAASGYCRASLKLDSLDRPHIGYCDFGETDVYVRYAHLDSGLWSTESVGLGSASSLAVTARDVPHISYYYDPAGDLGYASKTTIAPPMADAGGPYTANEGDTVILDASDSSGNISLYDWDLDNDGEYDDATGVTTEVTFSDNGVFTVGLRVTDECGQSDTDTAEVTALNVAPTVDAGTGATINEGDTFSGSGSFTDPGTDTWTATVDYGDGSGVQPLTLTGNTFALSHTYAENGDYSVDVCVSDDDEGVGCDSLQVTVNNVAPSVDVGPDATIDEGGTFSGSGSFADPGADTWTATVDYGDGSGVQPLPLTGNTFALSHTYADNGVYTVEVCITDDDGDIGCDSLQVMVLNVAPSVDAEPDATINEGDTFSGSGSFTDPGTDTWTATVDYGDGSGIQSLPLTGNTFALSHTYADNGVYTVEVCVTDDDDGIGCDTLTVTVLNVAPTVGEISAPVDPVQVNTAINTSADFIDPGVLDTHTAVWEWGDDTTSAGTVNETGGSGSVSGSHIYTAAGVYTVKVTVTDKDGHSDQAVFQYVVVYDPEGGFITGGGWIDSPEGAYTPDPSLTGKATFGFVAKYKKGADAPTGQTQFQFKVADLNFHSDAYEWLVIAGPKAQFKGTGTINGVGNYGFMLTAVDAALTPSTEVDKFRIKIWDKDDDDAIVYDNQMGAEDDADPTTYIGGGSIVIHKAK